jgi:hypothetical protein
MFYRLIKRFLVLMFVATTIEAVAADQSFNITLRLGYPIVVTKVRDLTFPDTVFSGTQNIVVNRASANAASFTVTGRRNRSITRTIVPTSINMSAPGVASTITVDTFSIQGPTSFSSSGTASFTVGATARVLAASVDGDYVGTAAIRIVYQ